jgi:hypothetical protein
MIFSGCADCGFHLIGRLPLFYLRGSGGGSLFLWLRLSSTAALGVALLIVAALLSALLPPWSPLLSSMASSPPMVSSTCPARQ